MKKFLILIASVYGRRRALDRTVALRTPFITTDLEGRSVMRKWIAVAAVALLSSLAPSCATTNGGRGSDSFRNTEGEQVAIRVHLDRLGVVFRESDKEQLRANADAFGLGEKYGMQPTGEGELPLVVYAVPETTREKLIELAERIRAEQNAIVEQAGLLVTEPDSRTPNVMTNEMIVQLDAGGDLERGLAALRELGITVLMPNPYVKAQYLVAAPRGVDVLQLSRVVRGRAGILYAFPNFISVDVNFETVPAEPLFGNQWHLRNTGASSGTATADARVTFAWDITQGAAGTVVGVYELGGFDITHEDLAANLWQNAAEIAGTAGVDDNVPANGVADDINGWNFNPCTPTPAPGCGTATLTPSSATDAHATSVSGITAAPINGTGVSGSCPQCRFQPIFRSAAQGDFVKALPFGYAQSSGTPIVNNSWGGGGLVPATQAAITSAGMSGRGGLGTLIFFAAGNSPVDPCAAANPYVSHPQVIAVTGTSNSDRKVVGFAFGNCIGLMAPTGPSLSESPLTGTLGTTSVDRTGTAGYNNTIPAACFAATMIEPANQNYTNCFGGTSSATPLVSGIAGLMLTANPTLTQPQVRNALQDTTDRVQDSTGAYARATGFSSPSSGAATHGYGRVNGFEAVRLVAPAAMGGRGNVDILLRDNRLDWGNTDQPSNVLFEPARGFIGHWQSVDIKVDAPPFGSAPTNNAQFESFVDEQAEEGVTNRVHVRVRNRGAVTATNTRVKLHWTFAGAGLASLPASFWTNFPADTPSAVWNSLGVQTVGSLAYSGASVANTAGDSAAIVTFNFPTPLIDPSAPDPHHYCLFAVVDSDQDRPGPKRRSEVPADSIPDAITPTDNNVTHRNIFVAGDGVLDVSSSIYVSNPSDRENAVAVLRFDLPDRRWRVETSPFAVGERITLRPGERIPLKLQVTAPDGRTFGEVTVIQETFIGNHKLTGGVMYQFGTPPKEEALQRTERPQKKRRPIYY